MDQSNITLERMRTFIRVADRGNLSAVAREMNMGQSSITRHLHDLENALGVALLNRTTRRVALTEEGKNYYTNAVQILRLVDQASDEVRSARKALTGNIRLSCTAALGVRHISKLIFMFQDQHPGIKIDFSLKDKQIDLVREGVDIAIRLAALTDSTLKLRRLGNSRRILVGAPDYISRHGQPKKPEDFIHFQAIRMSNMAENNMLALKGPDGDIHTVPLQGQLQIDHGLAAREALLAGRGIGVAHLWLIDDLLANKQLEIILPDYTPEPIPLNMLIVPQRANIMRVRLLADFLTTAIKNIPGIQ